MRVASWVMLVFVVVAWVVVVIRTDQHIFTEPTTTTTVTTTTTGVEGRLPCPHECDGDCDPFSACSVCCHNDEGEEMVGDAGLAVPPCKPVADAMLKAASSVKRMVADIEALPPDQRKDWEDHGIVNILNDAISELQNGAADSVYTDAAICDAVEKLDDVGHSGWVAPKTNIANALVDALTALADTGAECAQPGMGLVGATGSEPESATTPCDVEREIQHQIFRAHETIANRIQHDCKFESSDHCEHQVNEVVDTLINAESRLSDDILNATTWDTGCGGPCTVRHAFDSAIYWLNKPIAGCADTDDKPYCEHGEWQIGLLRDWLAQNLKDRDCWYPVDPVSG